jgi:hypothetical protein
MATTPRPECYTRRAQLDLAEHEALSPCGYYSNPLLFFSILSLLRRLSHVARELCLVFGPRQIYHNRCATDI